MDRSEESRNADVDTRHSPFYEWLDHAAIRELVHQGLALTPGERLVLIKGLVPGLVDALGLDEFNAFLAEVGTKALRYQEAVDHPGEGKESRTTPGEELGGPTPEGHGHVATVRDADRKGAREAERAAEGELWNSERSSGREKKK